MNYSEPSPGRWRGGSIKNGAEGQNAEELHVPIAAGTVGWEGEDGAGWTEPGDPLVSRGTEERKQPLQFFAGAPDGSNSQLVRCSLVLPQL